MLHPPCHPRMTAKGESVGDSRGISRPRADASLLLWLWTQRGARRRARVGWGAGRAAREKWLAVQAGWASLALLAAGADALRAQGRAVACADASSEAHRIAGPAVRAS